MAETTRHLYVLRHAKSSWDEPAIDDSERPLAPRGREAAKMLAKHLRSERIRPQLVLSSTARRALETLERVDPEGERLIEPELYQASAGGWVERLNQVPDQTESVMAIGHNPALQRLVLALSGPNEQVENKFPTGALATLRLDCAWSELEPGRATLTALVRPKDLR